MIPRCCGGVAVSFCYSLAVMGADCISVGEFVIADSFTRELAVLLSSA